MIFGELENFEQEKMALAPMLQKGLRYLKDTDLGALSMGRHDIEGDKLFALVSEYEVEPKETKQPESHERYIDIQYIAQGEELICGSFLSPACKVSQDELQARDLKFYSEVGQETPLVLIPGRYAVFFPRDIHRPGCINSQRQKVKKIVIKIAVDSLLG